LSRLCGQIDIGNAATEITERIFQGIQQANGTFASEPLMDLQHVAKMLIYKANLPIEANVRFLRVMPAKMPFLGRG
jgi:hypothetical protein